MNQNFKANSSQISQTQNDWSTGYKEHFSDDLVWSVKIDPSSGTIIVKVLVDSTPSTILLIPLRQATPKSRDQSEIKKEEVLNPSPEDLLTWVCAAKGAEIPDLSMALGKWPEQMPKPEFSEQFRPSGCR